MKKHTKTALIIFVIIIIFTLADHFIRWDETPLEQSILALPLVIGFLLKIPMMILVSPLLLRNDFLYEFISQINLFMSLLTGVFYSALYYFIALGINRGSKTQPEDLGAK